LPKVSNNNDPPGINIYTGGYFPLCYQMISECFYKIALSVLAVKEEKQLTHDGYIWVELKLEKALFFNQCACLS